MRRTVTLATLVVLAAAVGGSAACKDSNANGAETPGTAAAQSSANAKDVNLPGVDTSPMTPRERHEFSNLVTEQFAPCPTVPVPVATCILDKRDCSQCLPAAKFLAQAVRAGVSASDTERMYKERFDPSAIKTLPLAGSPARGPEGAPVTIVEFADFECPHCRAAVPVIDKVLEEHPDKVRLVYKFVSLPMHVHAEPAARAAWAAGQQGKFWEMEHLLFERQEHLEQSDLERYAQMLKLDIGKWKSDMESQGAKDRVAQDHQLEMDLKLQGTPTIYINGRELDVEEDESLEDRVEAELGTGSAPGATSAVAAPSTAPSSSVAPAPSGSHAPGSK